MWPELRLLQPPILLRNILLIAFLVGGTPVMSVIDGDAIRAAYEQVRANDNDINWLV
jgi:hypothetical protein